MLQLYASMLHERRIIVTCSKLSTLTACLHGSAALLFPMFWQHIYIPVLPPHLLDYCCAPMPYLIGIHSSLIERVKNKSLEDVVMLNVDTNTLESPFNDLINLPSDVVSALKHKLKKQSTATGDGVARAFLRAQAALFGSYRDALRYKPGEPVTFCEESFVKHRSGPMKQFLETAVNLQLFKQFIDGRLAKLNSGRGFSDVFEEEITSGGFCGGSPRSYQQWVHTVKKGGALFNSAMTRATPAVRTAYKFAKSQAKQGIREVKSKLKHKESEDGFGTCSGCVQYTPVYIPHGEKAASPEKRRLTQTRVRRTRKSLDGPVYDDADADSDRTSKSAVVRGRRGSARGLLRERRLGGDGRADGLLGGDGPAGGDPGHAEHAQLRPGEAGGRQEPGLLPVHGQPGLQGHEQTQRPEREQPGPARRGVRGPDPVAPGAGRQRPARQAPASLPEEARVLRRRETVAAQPGGGQQGRAAPRDPRGLSCGGGRTGGAPCRTGLPAGSSRRRVPHRGGGTGRHGNTTPDLRGPAGARPRATPVHVRPLGKGRERGRGARGGRRAAP
ncbi:DENN domain containing 1B [Phyllostomus discolor]|uniref:DENN domain containing 1B n=1 Tax=Phyllostomus discolor TaxID=89673 RepID=A0A834DAN0_9CHIR|nr:DENN domain containing 1B [Phyllostomus discolor]